MRQTPLIGRWRSLFAPQPRPRLRPHAGGLRAARAGTMAGLAQKSWREWLVVMAVFAVTGSSSMLIVRPVLRNAFGVEGSYRDGPNSYRAAAFLTTFPIYSALLLATGTLAGQRAFFGNVVLRMWGRLLPLRARARLERLLVGSGASSAP